MRKIISTVTMLVKVIENSEMTILTVTTTDKNSEGD